MKKNKEILWTIGAVFCLVILMYISGIGCPLLKLSGIPCMGCGMTRAGICLLHLDFTGAWYYHPLIYLMPFCIAALFLAKRMPKKLVNAILVLVVILFAGVYVMRLADPSNEVVKWNIENGVIYQTVMKLLRR